MQAEQLGVDVSQKNIQHALTFIVQRQHADGSWEEDQSLAEFTPPWVLPGERAARLYLTANCAFWLAMQNEESEHVQLAADFLSAQMNERSLGFLQTHWLAAGVWHQLNRSNEVEKALHELSLCVNDLSPMIWHGCLSHCALQIYHSITWSSLQQFHVLINFNA